MSEMDDSEMAAYGYAMEENVYTLDDAADGAALRRLREALPEGASSITVVFSTDPDAVYAGPWEVTVYGLGQECYACHRVAPRIPEGYGATIAEAADKCREALG